MTLEMVPYSEFLTDLIIHVTRPFILVTDLSRARHTSKLNLKSKVL